MKSNFPEVPKTDNTQIALEHTADIANIFLSPFPIIGPSIYTYLNNIAKERDRRKTEEFLSELEIYLYSLPRKILTSDEFVDAIKKGFSHFMDEPSRKKREYLINLNRNFLENIKDGKPVYDIYYVLDGLFEQLSLPAIDCLVKFKAHFGSKASRYDIICFFNENHGVHGKRAFLELYYNGLIDEDGVFEMPPMFTIQMSEEKKQPPLGQRTYKIQALGEIFVEWISKNIGYDSIK